MKKNFLIIFAVVLVANSAFAVNSYDKYGSKTGSYKETSSGTINKYDKSGNKVGSYKTSGDRTYSYDKSGNKNVRLLIIEGADKTERLENERRLIIDNDLCTIPLGYAD